MGWDDLEEGRDQSQCYRKQFLHQGRSTIIIKSYVFAKKRLFVVFVKNFNARVGRNIRLLHSRKCLKDVCVKGIGQERVVER